MPSTSNQPIVLLGIASVDKFGVRGVGNSSRNILRRVGLGEGFTLLLLMVKYGREAEMGHISMTKVLIEIDSVTGLLRLGFDFGFGLELGLKRNGLGGNMWKIKISIGFIQDVWINIEAYESSTPMRCRRFKRIKIKSGDVGVKNGILTPGGEKKRRIHWIGEIRKKKSDNICEEKIMAILKGGKGG
ncbi:hypothetical protein Tco_0973453 [Tanacetum coccineum]